jgi:hypothetical protein
MTPTLPDIAKAETVIVELTNAFRQDNKLAVVVPNAELTLAARAYANYLAATGTFSHSADGRQVGDRAKAAGYVHCQVAENLALNMHSKGFETSKLALEMVEGWKESPGHRANMLQEHVTEIGVAIARVPHKHPKFVAVQLVGRPASLTYKFNVANATPRSERYEFAGEAQTIESRMVITHTACMPAEIAFEVAGPAATPKMVTGRYKVRDGDVFTLKSGKGGKIIVELEAASGTALRLH